ncbi:cupin domain-containing protein [Phyllobacterium sp. SB3]|uniref:cupin domain-containing protein n=1 Tax=Phyllobacterium sp. SB3 TaxID=3156073 RepID=UPI0032AF7B8C
MVEGTYFFDVDGDQFYAEEGDVITVPGVSAHAFVNVSTGPARRHIMISPGMDAIAFSLLSGI